MLASWTAKTLVVMRSLCQVSSGCNQQTFCDSLFTGHTALWPNSRYGSLRGSASRRYNFLPLKTESERR